MLGNLGNMANLMKMAKDMQSNMAKAKEELAQFETSSSSGDGRVQVTVSGDFTLKKLVIDPEFLKNEDHEIVEDLIIIAVNNALKEVKNHAEEKLSGLTGGMSIPGLF